MSLADRCALVGYAPSNEVIATDNAPAVDGVYVPVPERQVARPRRSPWSVFTVAFGVVFLAMAIWSNASPLFAGPDEPVHVMKAAALVRGELFGADGIGPSRKGPGNPTGYVTLPLFYAVDRKVPICFHTNPSVPASCTDTLIIDKKFIPGGRLLYVASNAQAIAALPELPNGIRCPSGTPPGTPCPGYTTTIYNIRYPPLYYAIVGLPSLVANANWAVYLMRLMSAALSALFIALALTAAVVYSRTRFVLCGVIVAATPMAIYLGGVVNPTGLEVSCAIAVWTSGIILVRERIAHPPNGLVAILATSMCFGELIRGLSPFWFGLSSLVLLCLASPRSVVQLFARRSVQIGLTAVIICGVIAVSWILHEHTLDVYSPPGVPRVPASVSELTILERSFQRNAGYIPGMVGVFGSFDTYAPLFSYVVWYVLVGILGIGAVILGRARAALVVLAIAVLTVILPVIISSSQVHKYGYIWSGRDTLPLFSGLPIVASAVLGERLSSRRRTLSIAGVAVAAGLAQAIAFSEALRRYALGTKSAVFAFLIHPKWQPPLGVIGSLVAELLITATIAVLSIGAVRAVGRGSARTN